MVRDNGSGIPENLLARVFEPYMTTKQKGTGLGLAIVKKIVEEHGGQITIRKTADGGTCVSVILPLAETEAEVYVMTKEILVVDDEVGIRELFSEILFDEGYHVHLAENAGRRATSATASTGSGAARYLDAGHRRPESAQGMGRSRIC